MIQQELKRTIENHTDTPIDWTHVSMLNDMFKALNLNVKLETEEEPFVDFGETINGQIIKLSSGSFEKVNEK